MLRETFPPAGTDAETAAAPCAVTPPSIAPNFPSVEKAFQMLPKKKRGREVNKRAHCERARTYVRNEDMAFLKGVNTAHTS